jgi:CheY-like chemotaxis protein
MDLRILVVDDSKRTRQVLSALVMESIDEISHSKF